MENISLKNILWIIFGFIGGYFAGQIVGALLGSLIWAFIGFAFGGFVYQATSTIITNTILSVAFGTLLSYLTWSFDKRFFGSKMSFLMWGLAGAIAGLVVMFTYGINIISHPEIYGNFNRLNPLFGFVADINNEFPVSQPPGYLSQIYYGSGTGQFIGIYLGMFAGMLISVRETMAKKRKAEDRKEFDEYSNFFKERLKK